MFIFIYLIIFCCTCKNGTDYIDSKQSKHGGDHATAFDSWDFGSFTAGDTMISKCKKLNKEERRHTAWQAQRAPLKKHATKFFFGFWSRNHHLSIEKSFPNCLFY